MVTYFFQNLKKNYLGTHNIRANNVDQGIHYLYSFELNHDMTSRFDSGIEKSCVYKTTVPICTLSHTNIRQLYVLEIISNLRQQQERHSIASSAEMSLLRSNHMINYSIVTRMRDVNCTVNHVRQLSSMVDIYQFPIIAKTFY